MGKRSAFQGFRLEVGKVLSIAELIDSGVMSRQNIARALAMGQRKVRSLSDWGCMANILEGRGARSTTELYPYIRRLKDADKRLQVLQLIYYWICRNNPIINYLVHQYEGPREFDINELSNSLIESGLLSGKRKSIKKAVNNALKSLMEPEGLKDLGIIQSTTEGTNWYSMHSQHPDPLIAAYIIYANWPSHTAKVSISEIVSGRNSVGRIFFLTKFQVMSILRELEDRGLIKIETAAGLDQIGRDPRVTPDDVLEMIVAEA